ncbi:MAG: glycosyltransferase family 2 protein [Verrucomicrobiota bacterium]
MPRLSIVVPLYNEADNVGPLQDQIDAALDNHDFELILVDDGSTDNTVNQVKRKPHVRLLEFEKNAGQSAALYAGIQAADGAIIALLDGDLQNDPADILKLVNEVENGADLACGYRANRKDTAFKRLQSRIANSIRSRFTGDGVRDTGCTLKAMRRECRDALVPFTGMHRFIPALLKGAGYSISEVPVRHRPRHSGNSKYGGGLKRAIPATRDMFGVKWLLQRRFQFRIKK